MIFHLRQLQLEWEGPTGCIGEREVIYRNLQDAFERTRRLAPRLEATRIPDAAHMLNLERPEAVNARLASFLGHETEH